MPDFVVHPETRIEGVWLAEKQRKTVSITKAGNEIFIGEGADISGIKLEIFGTGNRLIIGKSCRLRGHILIKGQGQTVTIGDHTTFTDAYLLCADGADISIGRWCMLSRGIEIRTSDAHSLIDAATGQRINDSASIRIGDHVWIGLRVILNKGVVIGDDNVIGAGAFVNKSFVVSQCAIAGAPAKIVREGITWHRSQRPKFSAEEMAYWKS